MYGPVLLTQLVMLPISQRTVWDLQALFDPRPIEAIRDTLAHYSATLVGVPLGGGIGASPARYGTYFLGVAGFVLLVIGIVWGRRTARTRFLLLLLVAIPVIDLVGLLLTPLLDGLGFLKSFQVVRVRQLFTFALVANAAIGLDVVVGWWTGERERPDRRDWRWVVVAAAVIPLAFAGVVAVGQVIRRRRDLVALDVDALGWALLLAALVVGGVVIVVALAGLWRTRGAQAGGKAGWLTVLAILALLAGERAMYAHGERFVGPYIGDWASSLGLTPGQQFILAQPGADRERVLSFGENVNRMAAVGLLQADGTQAIYPVAYHALFGALIRPQLDMDPAAATYFDKWGNRAITFGPNVDPELVALVGARWLYVRGEEVPTVPDAVPRFRDGDVTVYEVPSVLPRAFLAGAVQVRPDPDEVVADLSAADLATLRGTAFVVEGSDAEILGSVPRADAARAPRGRRRPRSCR